VKSVRLTVETTGVMDFKQQFGLDYLGVKPPNQAVQERKGAPSLPQGLGDAVIAYSAKVIDALNANPTKTMRLFDIARQLSTRVDTLSPVIRVLVSEGYLERTAEDSLGDDTFKLTDSGKKVAAT